MSRNQTIQGQPRRKVRACALHTNSSAAAVLAALCFAPRAGATITEVGPGDGVEAAMNALKPGDELVLRGGTYTLTDAWHVTMRGTAQAPIIVRAKDGEHPHLDRPAVDQNIIDFDDVQYAEFRGIEVSGGSAGLRLINVNFMTIRDCEVHHTDDVAISANSGTDYNGLRIIHNHIHDTGGTSEGMYIGCNSNACRVHDSVFQGNHIHHTNGPNVSQGDGIEIKEGSYANVVEDNVIHDTGYPCIITYSTVGNGGPNVIERNVLWNCGDHGIQSAADVIIRNNVILGSAANGIANQPHQAGTPSNIQIVHNTILHPTNDAIASTGITGSVLIANNAVYSRQGNAIRVSGNLGQVVVDGNVGMGSLAGVTGGLSPGDIATDFVAASFSGAPPNDVFPRPGSKLIAAGNPQHVVADDFNGILRHGVADVGAYAFAASGNPGWHIEGTFKDQFGNAGTGGGTGSGGAAGSGGVTGGGGAAGSAGVGGGGGTGNAAGGRMAGAGGNAGSTSVGGSSAAGSDGGVATPGGTPNSKDSSGCGCHTASSRTAPVSPWPVVGMLLVARARRRRPRAAEPRRFRFKR
jgi:MYXO-CTERM domain-containing protein